MSYSTTPTAQELRTLPTAEIAMLLLESLGDQPNPNNLLRSHEQAHGQNREPDADFLMQRVSDAWAWLVAHALVGPHHRNTPSEWYRITDRGQKVIAAGSSASLLAEQRLPEDLHGQLEEARSQFRAGKSEIAVFAAMRQVEVRLRELSRAGNDMIGVGLARYTLRPEGGPLADDRLEPAERESISHLFAGALGAFKNPTSHRVVDFDDAAVAADIILLADLLMRLLDQGASTQRDS